MFPLPRLIKSGTHSALGLVESGIKPGLRLVTMKIVLQHIRTQLYLRSLGNWTANPLEAHDFQHSQRAIDFAREHGLNGIQIAVKFIDSQFDEVFPMPAVAAMSAKAVA
jgi:hypothetical protein